MRIATRGSQLALRQADAVLKALRKVGVSEAEIVVVSTSGDLDTKSSIAEIGGKGVFAKEVQEAVLSGEADIAVHSAKDLTAITPEGLQIAAVLERADPRDVLVGCALADLPEGATVATGAPRRRAQLAAVRPDLKFADLRGNIATRLAKAGDYDAIVVAAAALERLEVAPEVAEPLDPEIFVPQVAQGIIAVECRKDDRASLDLLSQINHYPSRVCMEAERAFLQALGGDCDLPAGAYATVSSDAGADTAQSSDIALVISGFLADPEPKRAKTETEIPTSSSQSFTPELAYDTAREAGKSLHAKLSN